jgi:hypothetical protein
VDFAKQEKVLQELERTVWDLVIIDEAHHCVRLGSSGDWEDSRRRRLAEVLASRCDGLLLLTATPHDGFDPHFASLVELLDPSLVDGRGGLRAERYRQHVVRRLKNHIKDPETGEPLFRTRQVTPRAVMFNAAEQPEFTAFQQALLAAVAPRIRQAVRQGGAGLCVAAQALGVHGGGLPQHAGRDPRSIPRDCQQRDQRRRNPKTAAAQPEGISAAAGALWLPLL